MLRNLWPDSSAHPTASGFGCFMLTRFAPSPTGELHLGHAYSALLAHDAARRAGGRFRLRIDDIDGSRSREAYVAAALADLPWLGIERDGSLHHTGRAAGRERVCQ